MSHVKVSEVKKNIKKHKNIMAEQNHSDHDYIISYDCHVFVPKALQVTGFGSQRCKVAKQGIEHMRSLKEKEKELPRMSIAEQIKFIKSLYK